MNAIRAIFGWVARHALLWLLLIAALLVWQGLQASQRIWAEPDEHRANASSLEDALTRIEAERASASAELMRAEQAARDKSADALEAMIAEERRERDALIAGRRSEAERKLSIVLAQGDEVVADQTRELKIQLQDRKIAGLEQSLAAARERIDAAAMLDRAREAYANAQNAYADKKGRCDKAKQALSKFDREHPLNWVTEWATKRRDGLVATRNRQCRGLDALEKARDRAKQASDALNGAQAEAVQWVNERIAPATDAIEAAIAAERDKADNSLRARAERKWDEWGLSAIVWQAFILLLGVIAAPYLTRLLFWFVLAPIAERRASIRIAVPGGAGTPMPPAERSATSLAVQLAAGEEMLVRQDYLQSSSATAQKATQWFLDWRHPFSSLASGLWFLTRIRGAGEVTTVSAVHDPFAEVALVTLPTGGAAVIHARALAAVVQPQGQPMAITSHWRLFSLNAWLTLQLRYLVFHGPAKLVMKGGRGVRVEPAGAGRIFAQDQLVGFSADLAYAVTRTETFWPYFLGREQLLKDRVLGGEGMLIVEEAPMAGRKGRGAAGGLEGAFDAARTAVGL